MPEPEEVKASSEWSWDMAYALSGSEAYRDIRAGLAWDFALRVLPLFLAGSRHSDEILAAIDFGRRLLAGDPFRARVVQRIDACVDALEVSKVDEEVQGSVRAGLAVREAMKGQLTSVIQFARKAAEAAGFGELERVYQDERLRQFVRCGMEALRTNAPRLAALPPN